MKSPEVEALKKRIFDTLDTIKRQGEVMARRNGDTRPAETVVTECDNLSKLLVFLYEPPPLDFTLESPDSNPPGLDEFKARDFKRINRHEKA